VTPFAREAGWTLTLEVVDQVDAGGVQSAWVISAIVYTYQFTRPCKPFVTYLCSVHTLARSSRADSDI
jgi:hypothetical protein